METAIAERRRTWSADEIDTIKATVARGATDTELKMLLHLSEAYGLDPFAKEIWFIKQGGQPVILTSRDGYMKIANNNPDFDGIVADVVYEGDEFEKTAGDTIAITHRHSGVNRGQIVGAYALVYRKSRRIPVYVFAPFRDYAKTMGVWKQYPHAMILKVAEAMALKRAFSLSGLVTREELDEGAVGADVKPKPAPAYRRQSVYQAFVSVYGKKGVKDKMLELTGGKPSKDWTDEDCDNLEQHLKQHRDDVMKQAAQQGGVIVDVGWEPGEPIGEPAGPDADADADTTQEQLPFGSQ